MTLAIVAAAASAALFVGMLVAIEIGRRLGAARLARDPEILAKGFGVIDAAVFSLLGLLIAFTFSSAATKFDTRRHLMGEETNAIGTAYLRIDLLPADAQPQMRELFRRYADSRLAVYRDVEDLSAGQAELAKAAELQDRIWTAAVAAFRRPDAQSNVAILFTPALNGMFDICTTQTVMARTHPPAVVFGLIVAVSLLAATLAGYGLAIAKHPSRFHAAVFAGTMSLAVYVIVDIEYPRLGLVRIDASDQVLIDLRNSMK